jgi:hypothetical protein
MTLAMSRPYTQLKQLSCQREQTGHATAASVKTKAKAQ